MNSILTPRVVGELMDPWNDELRRVVGIVSRAYESIPNPLDLELIKTYFSDERDIVSGKMRGVNLDKFTRENEGYCLKIESVVHDRGYYFFPEVQGRNHEARMEAELVRQKKFGRVIDRKFTDYQEGISGFSWRK